MMRTTHVVFGLGLSMMLASLAGCGPGGVFLAGIGGVAGAWLPDLDLRLRHRSLLHSLTSLALVSLSITLITLFYNAPLHLAVGFIVGYGSHILLDMLTVGGVSLFYPFKRRRYRLARAKTSDPLVNMLVTALGGLLSLLALLGSTKWLLHPP